MAFALSTVDRDSKVSQGKLVMVGTTSGMVIKKGDIVVLAAASGLAWPGGPCTAAGGISDARASGDIFAGVAHESLTATATYAPTSGFIVGSNCLRVETTGEFEFNIGTAATANIGDPVYAAATVNPNTVTLTLGTAKNAPIGIVTWVNLTAAATKVRVRIDGYALGANGIAST